MKRIVLITCILFLSHLSFSSQYNTTQTNNSNIIPFTSLGYQVVVNNNSLGTYTRNNTVHIGNTTKNRKARRAQNIKNQQKLSVEDQLEKQVNTLDKYINEECLGMSDNCFFSKRVTAFVTAKYKTLWMYNDDALLELEDCLLGKDKSFTNLAIIEKLRAKNTYFDALMCKAQQEVTEQFTTTVTGMTLDDMLNHITALPDELNAYLSKKPLQMYADMFNINKSLQEINMDDYGFGMFDNTNLILFQKELDSDVNYSMYSRPLCLSTDQLYLKGTDIKGNILILNLLTGKQEINTGHIVWDKKSRQENGYMDNPKNNIGFIPYVQNTLSASQFKGHVSTNNHAVIPQIMVRPTLLARFCQIALINSYDNIQELSVLLKSKSVHSLRGIPKAFLKELINRRIHFLKNNHA